MIEVAEFTCNHSKHHLGEFRVGFNYYNVYGCYECNQMIII